jgi:hypothetical protein
VGFSGGQKAEAAFQVGAGRCRLLAFEFKLPLAQMRIEKVVVSLDGSIVGSQRFCRLLALDLDVALQRVKKTFAWFELDGLVQFGLRDVQLVFTQCLGCFVVRFVRGLDAAQERCFLLIAVAPGVATGRQSGNGLAVVLQAFTRRRMRSEQAGKPVFAAAFGKFQESFL